MARRREHRKYMPAASQPVLHQICALLGLDPGTTTRILVLPRSVVVDYLTDEMVEDDA